MLKKLKLINYRNFEKITIDVPIDGLILCGDNGTGKTSIIESINMLTMGKSHRGSIKKNIINKKSEEFYIEGEFYNNKTISYGFSKKNNKTVIKINGTECKSITEWFGIVSVISFGPLDSEIVFGSPSVRRNFIDVNLSLKNKNYLSNLINYKKALTERNRLLSTSYDNELITIYEEKMAHFGSFINFERINFINEIKLYYKENIDHIFGYKTDSTLSIKHNVCINVDNYVEMLITYLKNNRNKDKIVGFSTFGPHRDDLLLTFNSCLCKNICSRGQGMIVSLALKTAVIKWMKKNNDNDLIFLIDDAFSELDINKKKAVYSLFKNNGQIIITSFKNENIFDDKLVAFELNDIGIKNE